MPYRRRPPPKKKKKQETAVEAEFRQLKAEVVNFARSNRRQKQTANSTAQQQQQQQPKRLRAVDALPAGFKIKKPHLPFALWKRSVAKHKRLAEKAAARAPPPGEDPMPKPPPRKQLQRNASDTMTRDEWRRKVAGDRSGLRGVGDGSRGVNEIGVGRFRGGVLEINPADLRRGRSAAAPAKSAPKSRQAKGWLRKGSGSKRPRKK